MRKAEDRVTAGATIHTALLAFHADAEKLDLAKNRAGVHSEYLDLDALMGQIRPLLAEHGLYPSHYTGRDEDGAWFVGSRVTHAASGESIDSGPYPLKPTPKDDAQGWGGGLTYARRYTLMAALALVADNDADGAAPRQRKARAASGKINAAQRNEMMAAARAASVPTDRLLEIVKQVCGVEASADIPAETFKPLLAAIRKEPPPKPAAPPDDPSNRG